MPRIIHQFEVPPNYHIVDLLRLEEIATDPNGGPTRVRLFLARDDVTCLAVLPRRISIGRARDGLNVRVNRTVEDSRVKLCDRSGKVLASAPVKDRQAVLVIDESAGKAACVKLCRNNLLLKSVLRTLWCAGTNLVVVADQTSGTDVRRIGFHWHGHRDAAWWSKRGWVLVHLRDASVWLTSPQAEVNDSRIQLLDGSRGQLTLVTEADPQAPVTWWVFALDTEPPTIKTRSDGKGIEVMSHKFSV